MRRFTTLSICLMLVVFLTDSRAFANYAGGWYEKNDFEGSVGPEWSSTTTDVTPGTANHSTDTFLGQFYNDTVSLTLNSLPSHTQISIEFDLYIIRSWDGLDNEPDFWGMSVYDPESDTTLYTYTTTFCKNFGDDQSFPDEYGFGSHPKDTGAAEINKLGFTFSTYGIMDAVYSFPDSANHDVDFIIPHSGNSVVVNFFASELEFSPSDESWGIDNVLVTPEPTTVLLLGLGGLALRRKQRE